VTGEFDHDHSIELGPKTRDGQLGYHVFTPLKRGEGQDTILVNRGFVKREFRDPKARPASLVSLCPTHSSSPLEAYMYVDRLLAPFPSSACCGLKRRATRSLR
jgi:hypothetical protein